MPTAKKQIGFRLSDKSLEILRCGKKQLGIPQTNILEMAIRDYARKAKIEVPCDTDRTADSRAPYGDTKPPEAVTPEDDAH